MAAPDHGETATVGAVSRASVSTKLAARQKVALLRLACASVLPPGENATAPSEFGWRAAVWNMKDAASATRSAA